MGASLVALPALAAGPVGFNAPAPAQGFTSPANGVTTVADILASAPDDAIVTLRGRFTEHVRGDDYVFTDEKGTKIRAELDDDKDWSMVKKDALVEITAEVDRDWTNSVDIEVLSAKPLKCDFEECHRDYLKEPKTTTPAESKRLSAGV